MTLCIAFWILDFGWRIWAGFNPKSAIQSPKSLFDPNSLKDRNASPVGFYAVNVAARECRVHVMINRYDRHFGIEQILGLRKERDAFDLIRLFGRFEAQFVELWILPVGII